MIVDRQTYDLIRRRASVVCYRKFGVNRYELGLLDQLCGLLRAEGRYYVGRHHLFDTVTKNSREKNKMKGYYHGLLRLKLIGTFEYIKVPGSECVGISDLGASVIEAYEAEIARLGERYVSRLGIIPRWSEANNSMYRPREAA